MYFSPDNLYCCVQVEMEEDTGASTPAAAPGAGKAAKEEEEDEEVQVGARYTSHTHMALFSCKKLLWFI